MTRFEKLEGYPEEIQGRFNSFITTQFDDSLSVEMQIRGLIKWISSSRDLINDMVDYLNLFIEMFDERLQEEIVGRLNDWLADGTLAQIINNDVFDMKADKIFVDSEIGRLDQKDEDLTTHLDSEIERLDQKDEELTTFVDSEIERLDQTDEDLTTQLEVIKHKQSQYISVTDFGAVGDGVTDDTVAVQSAIDSVGLSGRNTVLFFPPTNANEFLVGELTIDKEPVISFTGTDQTRLNFTSRICFRIKTESVFFNRLHIRSTHEKAREEGSVMFLDDREYNALDFDLKVENCNISNTNIVVKTKGRGVHLKNNEYHTIPGNIIHITVLPKTSVEEGHETIQSYEEGYRGYRIENSRLHYLTHTTLITVEGEGTSIVQGVSIVNNWIEGGCAYFRGKVNNLMIKGNQHYHSNYPWSSSIIEILGGRNIDIDLNINGMTELPTRPIVTISGVSEQVIIRGTVNGFKHHVVSITADVTQLVIDVVAKGVQKNTTWYPRMLDIIAGITVDGLRLDGMYHGVDVETSPIYKEPQSTVTNFKNNLIATGHYQEMPSW